eukprot:c41629_g1_i1 orf=147-386(+)
MVKLRHNQPPQLLKKKDDGKNRTFLSFPNFRRSFIAPRGNQRYRSGDIPNIVEVAHACVGSNGMGKVFPEEEQFSADAP